MYLGVVLPTIQERGEEGKARATHKTGVRPGQKEADLTPVLCGGQALG